MGMVTEQQILNAKILIVDDEHTNVSLLRQILEVAGYTNIRAVTDSREVVKTYQELEPDVILLDLSMPHLDGFQVMEQLKRIKQYSYLPVLVLTALKDPRTRLRALGTGAKDFLQKPFDPMEVRLRTRNILEVRLLYKRLESGYRVTERLLNNVLPAFVMDEMEATGTYVPIRHEDATVMFTDFQGFSRLAQILPPQQLLEELEVCFTYFDRTIQRYSLEKLKTIGDGYLCAGGLPSGSHTHPGDAVLAALEMVRFVQSRRQEMEVTGRPYWSVRIGIHTGPVVAGVIGKERAVYDVWGETVNVAKRIEENAAADVVTVSETTFQRVQSLFSCDYQAKIHAKNIGDIDVYRVEGIKEELSEMGNGVVPISDFYQMLA